MAVLDGINENSDPKRVRNALKQLLVEYEGKPLLVLLTRRDAAWFHLYDPLFKRFAHTNMEQSQEARDVTIPLGLYTEEEFRQARDHYFTRWDVNVGLGPDAAHILRLPLLLRIFAEAFQYSQSKYVPTLAENDLWRNYLRRKIEDISEGMGHTLAPEAIKECLERTAMKMLEFDTSSLTLQELIEVPYLEPFNTSPTSLMMQLQNASLLLKEQSGDQSGSVSFVYEAFFEFILGQAFADLLDRRKEHEQILTSLERMAVGYRWRHVPLYVVTLVAKPDDIIERLLECNLWLASQALIRVQSRVSSHLHHKIINALVDQLESPYTLDRRRASTLLGLLKATECRGILLEHWQRDKLPAALRALALLDAEETTQPLIRSLQGRYDFYWVEDQALIDNLSAPFRKQLLKQAILLLSDHERASAAVHTLGYLRMPEAINPLFSYLEAAVWCDGDSMVALLRIGTQEALVALKRAMGEAAEHISKGNHGSSISFPNPYQALEHLRIYGFQHNTQKAVVPFLIQLFDHPNFYVRLQVISSLEHLDAAETIIPLIKAAAVVDQKRETDWVILQTIQAIGSRIDVAALFPLLDDAATPDTVLRYAIEALGVSHDSRAFDYLVKFAEQRRCLFETIQALGNFGHPDAVAILSELLESKDIKFGSDTIVSQTFLEELMITALGRLHHPSAFIPVQRHFRRNRAYGDFHIVGALVATGGDQAIPLLHEVWDNNIELKEVILKSLLWLSTDRAQREIINLLQPLNATKAYMLVKALQIRRGLFTITRIVPIGEVDDRFIEIIDEYFDDFSPEEQWDALRVLSDIATLNAFHILERIAKNTKYNQQIPNPGGSEAETVQQAAIRLLSYSGSAIAIDFVLDELATSHGMCNEIA